MTNEKGQAAEWFRERREDVESGEGMKTGRSQVKSLRSESSQVAASPSIVDPSHCAPGNIACRVYHASAPARRESLHLVPLPPGGSQPRLEKSHPRLHPYVHRLLPLGIHSQARTHTPTPTLIITRRLPVFQPTRLERSLRRDAQARIELQQPFQHLQRRCSLTSQGVNFGEKVA